MSLNSLLYDTDASYANFEQSIGTLAYTLDPQKYENFNKCRMELGVVGGSEVSNIKGNLVDLESDLLGVTRKASKAPNKKYMTKCALLDNQNNCRPENIRIMNTANQKGRMINTKKVHLPNCQFIDYKPVPLPDPIEVPSCPKQKLF